MLQRPNIEQDEPSAMSYRLYELKLMLEGGFKAEDIDELREFIHKTEKIGQHIHKQFTAYAQDESAIRPVRATFDLAMTKRRGWVERSVKNPGNILLHSNTLANFIEDYDDDLPQDRTHLVALAKVHDKAEALIGDITPKDKKRYNITSDFKKKLEAMAICILYESPHMHKERRLIEEYEARETEASKIVADIDKCLAVMEALQCEKDEPFKLRGLGKTIYKNAQEQQRVKGPIGLRLFKRLEKEVEHFDETGKLDGEIMTQFEAAQHKACGRGR